MVNMKRLAVVAVAACAMAQTAQAISTSDKPASILTWPKIVVDSNGQFTGGAPEDTLVQLSNTSSSQLKQAHCFYVNANSHCADNPARVCRTAADCVGTVGTAECLPGWNEIDFDIFLTFEQPLAWYAGDGLLRGQFPKEGPFFCNAPLNFVQCFSDAVCAGFGCNAGQSNLGSGIPPVPEDPFIGSLTCVQFTGGNPSTPDQSASRNVLTGEAAIVVRNNAATGAAPTTGVDVAKYNAVGLTATGVANSGPSSVLQIGGDVGAEYNACPATLILSHVFDGASDPLASNTNQTMHTELTLVPCGNDFQGQHPGRVTAQFLVFNEFEQRFSTSRTVDCLFDTLLSNIDTHNPTRSIFSAGVGGSIGGQTRIRGVGSAATGRGLLGVARLLVHNPATGVDSGAAYNLHQQGNPAAGAPADVITIP